MRWPFSKRRGKLDIPPEDEQLWHVAESGYEGERLIVRFNEAARKLSGHPDLPIKLGFAIPFNRPQQGGFPDPGENQELAAVEDIISSRVLGGIVGVHAMTLTTGVMKEIVFYIAPGLDIARLHAGLREEVATHDVQCVASSEPDWVSFRRFVP